MTFFKSSSQRKIKKYLKKNGFTINEGSKHTKAVHNSTGTTIIFPRNNNISNGVTKSICDKLVTLGFDKTEIEKEIL